jgi:hypothetical protein
MKKNRDYLGIITIILAILLTASGGIYLWKTFFNDKKEPVDEDPIITETTINVVLKDIQVFRFDDLDFQFVIAELEVTSNKALDIGLEMFSTNEGITLENTAFYRDKLFEMGFTLEKFTLASEFKSDKKTLTSFVFIPIIDKSALSANLKLNLEKPITIPLDLTIANGTKDQVGLISTDEITDKTTYKISLGPIISINGKPMFQTTPSGDSSPVDFSDVSNLYAVQFTIEGLGADAVGLEEAKFTIDKSAQVAQALGKSYSVDGYTNLIKQTFTKATTGYFYLQLNSTSETILKQNGSLKLKLIGSLDWITVFYTK